eukprot:362619-Chlamydomonas_euryale.AAC.5
MNVGRLPVPTSRLAPPPPCCLARLMRRSVSNHEVRPCIRALPQPLAPVAERAERPRSEREGGAGGRAGLAAGGQEHVRGEDVRGHTGARPRLSALSVAAPLCGAAGGVVGLEGTHRIAGSL